MVNVPVTFYIYLAAPWVDKDLMPERAKLFEAQGHIITHRWWEIEDIAEEERTFDALREQAELDMFGVLRADYLILFNSSKSEGKAVEQGIAIAEGTPIIAIGTLGAMSKNVFHYLENYTWVDTIEEAVDALKR